MKNLRCFFLSLLAATSVVAQAETETESVRRGFISTRPPCTADIDGTVFVNYAGGESRCRDGAWNDLGPTPQTPNGESISISVSPGKDAQRIEEAIPSGLYDSREDSVIVLVKGDDNLVAEKIEKGTSIFGVVGTLEVPSPPEGDSFSISATPGKDAQRIEVAIPSGLYDSEEDSVIVSVAGDINLVGGNIAAGKTIFDVEGTLVAPTTPVDLTGDQLYLEIVNIHRTPSTRLKRKANAGNVGGRALCGVHANGLLVSYTSTFTSGDANTLSESDDLLSALVGGGGGYSVFDGIRCKN